jgi:2-phospho-L-lactate guanylyltransferase
MSCWALVPVRARSAGKQRLTPALDDAARARLVNLMLTHVLGVLHGCPEIGGVLVMTPDRDGLPPGALTLADETPEMNRSLMKALGTLAARGATRVAVILADLPDLGAADVSALVSAGADRPVALAPDHAGLGTNAACVALGTQFHFQFGTASLARHVAEAQRLGLGSVLVRRPGLAFDVDAPADLERLRARGEARFAFLG